MAMPGEYDHRGPWRTLDRREVYDNPWIRVEEHRVVHPGGEEGIYGVVCYHHVALGIVPVDVAGRTWLVGQHRYPLDRYSWEIPAGGGGPGEPEVEAAARELAEETGLTARRWDLLQRIQLSNSTSDEIGAVWLARDLAPGPSNPSPEEELRVVRLPLTEAFDRLHAGELVDSLTVAGLLRLEAMIRRGEIDLPGVN